MSAVQLFNGILYKKQNKNLIETKH